MANFSTTPGAAPVSPSPAFDDPERLLTFAEMCGMLQIGERLAWSLCNRGELPGVRVGRLWRFRRSTLIAWIEAREAKGVRR